MNRAGSHRCLLASLGPKARQTSFLVTREFGVPTPRVKGVLRRDCFNGLQAISANKSVRANRMQLLHKPSLQATQARLTSFRSTLLTSRLRPLKCRPCRSSPLQPLGFSSHFRRQPLTVEIPARSLSFRNHFTMPEGRQSTLGYV